MAQNFTQIVDFLTHIPGCDDHQPYLLDLFLCSNPDSCTIADHMVVSVIGQAILLL